ncbi:hypothetical protein HPP92_025590 [Vanilla planifolia]|uniref:Uncharacterized protein n=1 Tax=Vanilla planifolia TaxID=51239 RepID=A0A835UCH4_VANPL|nr:hypothetical protein HPP92_025590 [Vanilla planifolia]
MPTPAELRRVPSTSASKSFRGLSVLSFRRNQIDYMEPSTEEEMYLLELLHSRLAASLQSLHSYPNLSLPFLNELLDALLCTGFDFKALLFLLLSRNPALISLPSLDRAVSYLLDFYIKVLDICNDVSLSLTSLRHWNGHADIAATALRPSPPQLSRASRALSRLLLRNSLEKKMTRSWSAPRQLQSTPVCFAAPRGSDFGSAGVLAAAVHAMSTLLVFTIWAMTAAFPCCGGTVSPPVPSPASGPRQMAWAVAMVGLQERIVGEREREGKGEVWMLAETQAVERLGREVMEAMRNEEETAAVAAKMEEAIQDLGEGLGLFEKNLREVFDCVVRSREEVLRFVDEGSRH